MFVSFQNLHVKFLPQCDVEVSSLQPGRGLSLEPERAGALLTDFQNCEKQIPVVYKPPSSWHLVLIAQAH